MKKGFSNQELLSMSNEQVESLCKNKAIKIVFTNGESQDIYVKSLLLSAPPTYLFCGFLTKDDHTVSLQRIDHIELF